MKQNQIIRVSYIRVALFLLAGLLIFRAFSLQVLTDDFRTKAKNTTVERKVIYPARGIVYDRNMNLLIYNIPIYDLMVNYNQISPEMDTTKFCDILGIDRAAFKANLDKDWQPNNLSKDRRYSKAKPFPFIDRLSVETYARLQESLYQFPGFFVRLRNVRGYPNPYGAHVLGYLREVNSDEVERSKTEKKETELAGEEYTKPFYEIGDYKGASGIELQYDKELRGRKGYRFVLRDNLGREMGDYMDGAQDSSAVPGKDLMLSIDSELQAYAEQLMHNKAGGIIAIEPKTGEILSMVSAPTYDPNLLVFNRNRGDAYTMLAQDTNNIFFNRATMAAYPPGSIFKTVVALIGLSEGATTINRTIPCYGGYYYNGVIRPACHAHPTCHTIDQAIQHSCNAYFAQVFRNIVDQDGYTNPSSGLNAFNSYLDAFNLGKKLGIDFPQESRGDFYTSADYRDLYKDNNNGTWYSPYIMSVGIGQGEVTLTTLQMANVAATIANKGNYKIPHLAKSFIENKERRSIPEKFLQTHSVGIDTAWFTPIIDGMERVVTAGTARRALIPEIAICGKTGTAENPHGEDHSIFFAFAPKDDPKIAIAVYVEHGKFGGTIAAPIASLLIEKYLTREISDKRKYREDYVLNYQSLNTL